TNPTNGRFVTGTTTHSTIAADCFGNAINSFRDAAARRRMSETDFRAAYDIDYTEMRLSLDPEGRTAIQGTTTVPDPIGFFYDPVREATDLVGYYKQTQLKIGGLAPSPPNGATFFTKFQQSNTIYVTAQNAVLRTQQVKVPAYEGVAADSDVELDFTWAME